GRRLVITTMATVGAHFPEVVTREVAGAYSERCRRTSRATPEDVRTGSGHLRPPTRPSPCSSRARSAVHLVTADACGAGPVPVGVLGARFLDRFHAGLVASLGLPHHDRDPAPGLMVDQPPAVQAVRV